MSSRWSGFTEEDQAKIKLATEASKTRLPGDQSATRPGAHNSLQSNGIKSPNVKAKAKKPSTSISLSENGNHDHTVPTEALLAPKQKQNKGPESPVHVKLKIVENSSFEIMETTPLEQNSREESVKDEVEQVENRIPSLTLSVDLLQNNGKKEMIDLNEFEKRQKVIEEQNRLKKEMLGKALAMRKMKTQAEAQKLQQIQEELSRLDASLSNDVGILRSHIEIASVELSEAERRYSKAEREFIEAKQLLFTKRERKDMLTEHLCTIIEQNELRKAQRLTDLMVQLADDDQESPAVLNQVSSSETDTATISG